LAGFGFHNVLMAQRSCACAKLWLQHIMAGYARQGREAHKTKIFSVRKQKKKI